MSGHLKKSGLRASPLWLLAPLVVLLVGFLAQDALFKAAIRPSGSYRAAPAPARPEYAEAASWAIRPENPPPGGWETPWGTDVFFIHPTSDYAGDDWNTPLDNARALDELRVRILPNHAAAFASAAPLYAPLYRQAPLHAELTMDREFASALDLAYSDVLRAFDHYIEADNRSRAVIIAGSGQGGLHALRLLNDRFRDGTLKNKLAAAYIIDAGVTTDTLASLGRPPCETADSLHCVVSWTAAYPSRPPPSRDTPVWTPAGYGRLGKQPLACINPILWTPAEAIGAAGSHRGAIRATASEAPPELKPQSVSARCDKGILKFEGVEPGSLAASSGWGGKFKTPAFNLFHADIAFNAGARARLMGEWMAENLPKPAEPLPPEVVVPDAPIHRPDGKPDPVLPDYAPDIP